MRLVHTESGRALRLAYCLNLHPADTLAEVTEALRAFTLPLAERLGVRAGFGAGLYLASGVVRELETGGPAALDPLRAVLAEGGLDPFTYNAFPYARFHEPGLKQRVFEPTWADAERLEYTLGVARIAARLAGPGPEHVSVSTHGGRFGPFEAAPGSLDACADGLVAAARALARLEEEAGRRVVLAVEPEPRSSAGDTAEGARLLAAVRARAGGDAELVRRHLGTCLDTCHAAVEFEDPDAAWRNATADGAPLGKLQFSSALRLAAPAASDTGRERLLGLAEPVYLHQVTARRGTELFRALDLPDARARWEAGEPGWRDADEWRCHFHVPVDLGALGADAPLATTREAADALLARALADPERWGTPELHVEIETYTWDVLPGAARGAGTLVEGLEREYRHVLARLAQAGWEPTRGPHENPPPR